MDLLSTTGEGFEEIISNVLTAVGNDIVELVDNDFNYGMENQTGNVFKDALNAAKSEESLEAFISATLTSAIVNGGNNFISNSQKSKIIKSYAQDNNISLDKAKELFEKEYQKQIEGLENISNLKERTTEQQKKQNEVLSNMKNNTLIDADSSERTQDNINAIEERNTSKNLTKKEIKDIRTEVNNQNNNKIEQTVESSKGNKTNVVENSKSFSQQVDDVLNNKYPKRDMLVVSKNTPKILQDIGLSDLPITMTQKHLYTITHESGKYSDANYHNIDMETIKQIPEALSNPLNVLKSDTKDDSIVVVTELSDKNDDIIVASIKLDGKGTI